MTDLVVARHESRFARRLLRRRARIAVCIASAEAVLVLVGVIPWWWAVAGAVVSVAAYGWLGPGTRSPGMRTATWLAAVSQLIVVFVPVGIVLIGLLALVALAALGAVVLTALLLDRR